MKAAEQYLSGAGLFGMEKLLEESISSFTNFTALNLPQEIMTLYHQTLDSDEGGPELNADSIEKARISLNGLMEEAQTNLDLKTIECKTLKEKNQALKSQIQTDLARTGQSATNLEGKKTDATQSINAGGVAIQTIQEERGKAAIAYEEKKVVDEEILAEYKKDLAVAEFILRLSKCGAGKGSFMQYMNTPKVERCEDNGKETARFADDKLHKIVTSFSSIHARNHVEKLLLEATSEEKQTTGGPQYIGCYKDKRKRALPEQIPGAYSKQDCANKCKEKGYAVMGRQWKWQCFCGDNDPKQYGRYGKKKARKCKCGDGEKNQGGWLNCVYLVEAPVEDKPASTRKQANKCSLGTPDCGLLHDNMSLMWGKMKDEVDALESKMRKDSNDYEKEMKNFNDQTALYTTQVGASTNELGDATAQATAVGEEQVKFEKEERRLTREGERIKAECKEAIHEIVFTKMCGVLNVRGNLLKDKASKIKPMDVKDCQVADWIPQACSKVCDDSLEGGVQVMTREIIQRNNDYGVTCPATEMRKKCNQFPCPVHCKLSEWGQWGTCTKECGGGIQSRSRTIEQKPENGGNACETFMDSVPCNTGSCDRDCTLSEWKERPCPVPCGGGWKVKKKEVLIPARGNGKCAKKDKSKRLAREECNIQACAGDEECVGKLDIVIALDASGSVKEKGFTILRDFTAALVKKFRSETEETVMEPVKKGAAPTTVTNKVTAAQVGIVQFGNGALDDEGNVSAAEIVQSLKKDVDGTVAKVNAMTWLKGFTNMAQAFTASQSVFTEGRKRAQSVLILVTDGKPSFEFQTESAARKLRQSGVKVMIVSVKTFPGKIMEKMKGWVSLPPESNFVHIPGLKALEAEMDSFVNKVVVRACPKVVSPRKLEEAAAAREEDAKKGELLLEK